MPTDWLKQIRPWLPLILSAAGIMFLGAAVVWLGTRTDVQHARMVGDIVDVFFAAPPARLRALSLLARPYLRLGLLRRHP